MTWPAQIYRQLLEAILDGRLRSGERLPPTRELARRLAVSRNTVAVAYDRLVAEGFLVGRAGAGTYVSAEPAARQSRPQGVVRHAAPWEASPARLASGAARPARRPGTTLAALAYDFRVGVPDAGLFPMETLAPAGGPRAAAARVAAGYGDPAGHAGLREAIARHIGRQPVACAPAPRTCSSPTARSRRSTWSAGC